MHLKKTKGKKLKRFKLVSFYLLFLSFYHLGSLCISSYEKLPKGKVTNSQKSKSLRKTRMEGIQKVLPVQSLGRYIILKLCSSIAFLGKLKLFLRREKN